MLAINDRNNCTSCLHALNVHVYLPDAGNYCRVIVKKPIMSSDNNQHWELLHSQWWRSVFLVLLKSPLAFCGSHTRPPLQPREQPAGLCCIFSPPTFIFLKCSGALSICGVSIQPVSAREPLLLSALPLSVILSTSGGLPSLNLCGSTLEPPAPLPTLPTPVCLSCYKKQICLTFSFSCPCWGETRSVCSRMMIAVISMHK